MPRSPSNVKEGNSMHKMPLNFACKQNFNDICRDIWHRAEFASVQFCGLHTGFPPNVMTDNKILFSVQSWCLSDCKLLSKVSEFSFASWMKQVI